jgi:hypothetical protein
MWKQITYFITNSHYIYNKQLEKSPMCSGDEASTSLPPPTYVSQPKALVASEHSCEQTG